MVDYVSNPSMPTKLTTSTIPFNHPFIIGSELSYIEQAVQSGKISADGDFSRKCEAWLVEHHGGSKALLTHSCTAALEMAALLCEIEPGQLLSKVLLSQHERNQRQPVQTSPIKHRRNQRQPVQTSPTKHRRNGSPRLWSRAPVLSRSNRKAPRVRWPTARPSETLRRKPQQWMPPKKAKSWSQTLQFESQHGSKPSTTTKRAKVIESYSQWDPAPF